MTYKVSSKNVYNFGVHMYNILSNMWMYLFLYSNCPAQHDECALKMYKRDNFMHKVLIFCFLKSN